LNHNFRICFAFLFQLACLISFCNGQVQPLVVSANENVHSFHLAKSNKAASIYIDVADLEVVHIAATCFSQDVKSVTDILPYVKNIAETYEDYMVIGGTIGHNKLIDQLIQQQRLDVKKVKGKWETFSIALIDHPFKNVKQSLVIVGSDERATAYGFFQLSQLIGVAPFLWWADITPAKQQQLFVSGTALFGPPSVKYRGIFINDEDWGINPWAANKMDTDIKDIGPKTYARVCELLLRLKANYLWPAMHPCTKAFWYYPENPKVAQRYSIVLGASHCEPMLRNNVFEWNKTFEKEFGIKPEKWSYDINKIQIYPYWEERVKESKSQDAVYTVGMRGIHDGGMPGGNNKQEKIKILENVIADQRTMLANNLGKKALDIPQIFCPYKEVLDLYQSGMNLPDDITIFWPDDNFGYIRQVSNIAEQKRIGGSGIYYHLSYWGAPADYLWLSSTSPSLIAHEMSKAYRFGADKLWVFNVGDIKPAELETEFAMDLAWDINKWSQEKAFSYTKYWAEKNFGKAYFKEIVAIKNEYYLLAASSKPEHLDKVIFSLDDAKKRIESYEALYNTTNELSNKIPPALKDAYYELVQYPVEGACFMNQKCLFTKMGLLAKKTSTIEADTYFEKANKAYENIQLSTLKYNQLAGGKWEGMMSSHPRNLKVFNKPTTNDSITLVSNTSWLSAPKKVLSASDFINKNDTAKNHIVTIKGLGISEKAVTVLPVVEKSYTDSILKAPLLEYQTDLDAGDNQIWVKCLPTFRLYNGFKLQYAVSVNGDTPQLVNIETKVESKEWGQNVLRGFSVGKTTHHIATKGKATIKIYLVDPGIVINQIEVF